MEVLFEIKGGWYPAEMTCEFKRELEPYHKDVEFLKWGKWQRAALVKIYSKAVGDNQPADDDHCGLNLERHGSSFVTWREFKQHSRPYTPIPDMDLSFIETDKEFWDRKIDDDPLNWSLREAYADWLDKVGQIILMQGQKYQIRCRKTPGPACVQESAWHEATWFVECQIDKPWSIQGGIIKPEWCIPTDLFKKMNSHILQRRDGGTHNQYAKSWNSRREAEICLALSVSTMPRTIDSEWRW